VHVKTEGRGAISFLKMRVGERLVTELVNLVTANACVSHSSQESTVKSQESKVEGSSALSLGERVSRDGAFFSRRATGEGFLPSAALFSSQNLRVNSTCARLAPAGSASIVLT
jgi:hypothetical protein